MPQARDPADEAAPAAADPLAVTLGLVRELVSELHPSGRAAERVRPGSQLDRELGLDSLARMELLRRLERRFAARISEREVLRAATPAELAALVSGAPAEASPHPGHDEAASLSVPGALAEPPPQVRDLAGVLRWHAREHPDRAHVHLHDDARTLGYGALLEGAERRAAALAAEGVEPGAKVAIMLPTGADYLITFFGVLCFGAVPVPIYPPARPSQIEDHLRRHAGILNNAECVLLVTVEEALQVARLLRSQVPTLRRLCTPKQLDASKEAAPPVAVAPEDTALLQYTSGSTGQPKGVVLSHRNLLENIRAMGRAAHVQADDVLVSWLPLYHDMGLIGGWLTGLYYGFPVVLMSPLSFLARPAEWLWAVHHHRGTISASPNFGYDLCVRKVEDAEIEGLDLGGWRFALNGAEPVSPRTLRDFCDRFASHGFRRGTLSPVYGLAECAVGLCFPPMDRGPLIDRVQRERFAATGRALPVQDEGTDALEFVACGHPLPGHEVRVVDDAGREVPDRQQGRLQFRGPSTTAGYYRNPEASRDLFDGDWLESGDLAYVAAGDIYVTGRKKDIIIRAGRNLYPHELEDAVGGVEGVRRGCVAVFASTDDRSGTERLVVLAETRLEDAEARRELAEAIRGVCMDVVGTPPDEVALVPPHTVLKTSSGKIRRSASRQAFEQGRLGVPAARTQMLRVVLASLWPQLRRAWAGCGALAFAAYAWLVFVLVAPPAWLTVLVLPGAHLRWRLSRGAARLLAALTRTPVRIEGLANLPGDGRYVVVANHQSHLDGFVLVATLPTDLAIVAKAELSRSPWTRLPLDRLGVEYVERFDPDQSVAGAERLVRTARAGRSLLFFPEGTHVRMPGILPFHLGAFRVAAEAGLPVVPVVIRGTRSMLRPDTWFPRRGAIDVVIGPPLEPQGTGFAAVADLSRKARGFMLEHAGEPDLE